MQDAIVAVWGLLVGFVGWTSCFLMPEPMEKRLLGIRDEAVKLRAAARFLIMLFLMYGVLLTLSLPAMAFVAGGTLEAHPESWRKMLGIAFFASLGGLVVNGSMRRFGGRLQ